MTDQTDSPGAQWPMTATSAQDTVPPRRRSTETRQDILLAARRMFSEHPYAEVSLKDIAAEVGISAPLIIKYFGSKENLFELQLDFSSAATRIDETPFSELGEHLARLAVTSPPDSPHSIVHRLADAGGNRHIVNAISQAYREQVVNWLVKRIEEDAPGFIDGHLSAGMDAETRAEAAMSMLTGLSLMRRLVTEDFFLSNRVETFIVYYGALIQGALDGGSEPVT